MECLTGSRLGEVEDLVAEPDVTLALLVSW